MANAKEVEKNSKKSDSKITKTKESKMKTNDSSMETVVDIQTETPSLVKNIPQKESKVAKAGKRSSKAIKEAEELQAKEERKAKSKDVAVEGDARPKSHHNPARSRLDRRSKNYKKSASLIEKGKEYSWTEAIDLALKTSTVKFDASVELHIRLNVDPRQADQNIRQTLVLPAGSGKTSRVAVFADAEDVSKAKKAGADVAASDEFLQQLDKELINFDVLIASPSFMPKLGKYARILGPKGLMPNPKSGTVTSDITKAVNEAKAGKIEYRVDSTGIIHLGIGKISFGTSSLTENAKAVFASVKAAKPSSVKGNFVRSIYLTTSMGPSLLVASSEL